jgi:hypothetical protein
VHESAFGTCGHRDVLSQCPLSGTRGGIGFAVPATVLTVSDADAQTAGMERRGERRTGRTSDVRRDAPVAMSDMRRGAEVPHKSSPPLVLS